MSALYSALAGIAAHFVLAFFQFQWEKRFGCKEAAQPNADVGDGLIQVEPVKGGGDAK